MAVSLNPFDSWLSSKLESLNTDEGVFGSYIRGILEGDETEDEKTEALESILAGIMVRIDDSEVRNAYGVPQIPTCILRQRHALLLFFNYKTNLIK